MSAESNNSVTRKTKYATLQDRNGGLRDVLLQIAHHGLNRSISYYNDSASAGVSSICGTSARRIGHSSAVSRVSLACSESVFFFKPQSREHA